MKNFINNKKKRVVVSRNWDKSKISQDKKEKKKKNCCSNFSQPGYPLENFTFAAGHI